MAKLITKWIADASVTSVQIASNTIVDSNISSSAAIAESKLNLAYTTTALHNDIQTRILSSAIGAANGVAPLDGSAKVPVSYLPNSIMEYMGTFDPTLTPASPLLNGDSNAKRGDVYIATQQGTYDFGAGGVLFQTGDFAIYDGSVYQHAPAATGVVSVNGLQGAVVLTTTNISEGTNLYFTTARAKSAAVENAINSGTTDVAPSEDAVFNALALKVDKTTTVNGHALSSNVTVTKTDVGLGNVDNVQQLPMSYLDIDGTLAANSDVKVASQKATKTYADTKVPQTRTINGYALSSDVSLTKSDVSLGNVDNVQQLPMSYLDTDNTLAANSDTKVPSQKAIKSYTDTGLALKVDKTTTVNGYALSSNVSLTKSDVGLGNVDNVQQLPMSYLSTDGTMAADSDTLVPSQKAVVTYVGSQLATMHVPALDRFVLSSTDISNGYVDLSFKAFSAASISITPVGGPVQDSGSDYTVSLTGGTGGVTRITFAGDLSANLAAADILLVYYSK